jgi:hypothetical protein
MVRKLAQRFWRVITMRAEIEELYRSTHTLRQRLAASEAMVIALAWTHPDRVLLLEGIRHWMDRPADASLSDYLQALKRGEHERVTSHWHSLLAGGPTHPSTFSGTYH